MFLVIENPLQKPEYQEWNYEAKYRNRLTSEESSALAEGMVIWHGDTAFTVQKEGE